MGTTEGLDCLSPTDAAERVSSAEASAANAGVSGTEVETAVETKLTDDHETEEVKAEVEFERVNTVDAHGKGDRETEEEEAAVESERVNTVDAQGKGNRETEEEKVAVETQGIDTVAQEKDDHDEEYSDEYEEEFEDDVQSPAIDDRGASSEVEASEQQPAKVDAEAPVVPKPMAAKPDFGMGRRKKW